MFALPAIYLTSKIGIKWSLTLGLALFTTGNALDFCMNYNFYVVFGGQFVAGLGFPLFFVVQGAFCNEWFSIKSRPFIVAVTSIAGPVGGIFSFVNIIWFLAIIGIAISVGPVLWVFISPIVD